MNEETQKLIDYLKKEQHYKIFVDLPVPNSGNDAVGEYRPRSDEIHLSPKANTFTILHELGHAVYRMWQKLTWFGRLNKKLRAVRLIIIAIGILNCFFKTSFSIEIFFGTLCAWLVLAIPGFLDILFIRQSEQFADIYAAAVLRGMKIGLYFSEHGHSDDVAKLVN